MGNSSPCTVQMQQQGGDRQHPEEEEDCSSSSGNECPGFLPSSTSQFATLWSATASGSCDPPHEVKRNKASDLLISASDKAGMDGIDRERINEILLRESGNSTFMQRQRKMDDNTNRKIEEMKQRLEEINNASTNNNWRLALERNTIDPILQQYRGQRQPLSTCVVIDLDSFFISCHILYNPRLAEIPACVGGSSMISTSNYVARQYGVRAAMPGYLGSKLVSELSGGKETLTFIKSDFELYKKKSMEVRAVLEEFDPNLNMYSLDEAYMDIGPYLEIQLLDATKDHDAIRSILSAAKEESTPAISERLLEYHSKDSIHDAARSLLHSIREKVRIVTGLTCSAGLCSNFLLAKIASDINKPNGQHFVGPSEQEIIEFIHPLPLRKVNGIGRVMEKTLRGVSNIETVKDLYIKRSDVHVLFKPATAHFLLRASIGYSESKQHESAEDENGDTGDETLHRKGISHERTFSPTSSWSELCTKLEKISLCLVHDLRERNLRPKTITLKVKLSSFDILTRATTRDIALFQNCNNSHSPQDLVDIVVHMLKEVKREHNNRSPTKMSQSSNNPGSPFSVRLLGVRCSNFQLNEDNQQSMHRYQIFQNLINAENHPNCDNNSPIVKNPYVRPKIFTSNNEKLSTDPSIHNLLPPSDQKLPSAKKVAAKTSDETELGGTRLQCPICNKYFESDEDGNAVLNAHIDACLNATAVKQLAREETVCADERMRKKKCKLTDFFGY